MASEPVGAGLDRAEAALGFERLLARHWAIVYWVVGRALRRGLDRDSLAAAAQVGLWSAWRDFDPARGMSFATFAIKRMTTEVRRDASWQATGRREVVAQPLRFSPLAAARNVGYQHSRDASLSVWMIAKRAALTPRERDVLALAYECGLSNNEIGRRLGISEGAAGGSRRRGLEKLRRQASGPLLRSGRRSRD